MFAFGPPAGCREQKTLKDRSADPARVQRLIFVVEETAHPRLKPFSRPLPALAPVVECVIALRRNRGLSSAALKFRWRA